MNGKPDDLLRQLHESRKLKTSGIVLFDFAHLDEKYTDVLFNKRIYPEHSVSDNIVYTEYRAKQEKKKKRFWFFKKKGELTKAPSASVKTAKASPSKS